MNHPYARAVGLTAPSLSPPRTALGAPGGAYGGMVEPSLCQRGQTDRSLLPPDWHRAPRLAHQEEHMGEWLNHAYARVVGPTSPRPLLISTSLRAQHTSRGIRGNGWPMVASERMESGCGRSMPPPDRRSAPRAGRSSRWKFYHVELTSSPPLSLSKVFHRRQSNID